jgi:hypothetical protein
MNEVKSVGQAPAEEGSNDLGERHVLSLSAASRTAQAPEEKEGMMWGPLSPLAGAPKTAPGARLSSPLSPVMN